MKTLEHCTTRGSPIVEIAGIAWIVLKMHASAPAVKRLLEIKVRFQLPGTGRKRKDPDEGVDD